MDIAEFLKCEEAETEALDLVYAWLGGDRAARTLITLPEYRILVANIAEALGRHCAPDDQLEIA